MIADDALSHSSRNASPRLAAMIATPSMAPTRLQHTILGAVNSDAPSLDGWGWIDPAARRAGIEECSRANSEKSPVKITPCLLVVARWARILADPYSAAAN